MRLTGLLLLAVGCSGDVKLGDTGVTDGAGLDNDTAVSDSGDTAGDTAVEDTGDFVPGDEILPSLTMGGPEHALFGAALDEGDIDGDGRDDLLVGSPGVLRGSDSSTAGAGEVWIFFGPIRSDTDPRSATFTGISAGDAIGSSIAHGDFNKDGYTDVVIGGGMPTSDNPDASGFVSVTYGPITGSVALSHSSILGNVGEGDAFGASLVTADFSSDGYTDLAVGAPQEEVYDGTFDRGLVYIYHGSENGLADGDFVAAIGGDVEGAHLGESLATGDADGDGIADILIGAPQANGQENTAGAAYLFVGPFDGNMAVEDAHAAYLGDQSGDRMGASLDLADLDRDGSADVIVGAPGNDASGLNAGIVAVMYGLRSGRVFEPDVQLYGEQPGAEAGASVSFAHDINSDNAFDLAVGAPLFDEGATIDAGRGYLVLGPLSGSQSLGASDHVAGYSVGMQLGKSSLGDTELTGDSVADFVFGAPNANSPDTSMSGIVTLMAGY